MLLGGDDDHRVAADDRGGEPRDEPLERGLVGREDPTTPVGSGIVKLKYGPATGFVPPSTCASLSAQPAYQTMRSIEVSTSCTPEQHVARSARRDSIVSAIR